MNFFSDDTRIRQKFYEISYQKVSGAAFRVRLKFDFGITRAHRQLRSPDPEFSPSAENQRIFVIHCQAIAISNETEWCLVPIG
jgi:hypothetical protein